VYSPTCAVQNPAVRRLKVDVAGNVYCGGSAESTFSTQGQETRPHRAWRPETTNIAFGGDDWKTLYYTNWNYVGAVKVKIAGVPVPVRRRGEGAYAMLMHNVQVCPIPTLLSGQEGTLHALSTSGRVVSLIVLVALNQHIERRSRPALASLGAFWSANFNQHCASRHCSLRQDSS